MENNKAWLIAPSNKLSSDQFLLSKERLISMGFQPFYRSDILRKDLYFAGTLSRRVDEINDAFSSSNGSFVFAIKGGYASMELLANLDWDLILSSKKSFMGHSDITALLVGFYKKNYSGVLVHGPNIGSKLTWSDDVKYLDLLKSCLKGDDYSFEVLSSAKFLNKSDFKGKIFGGNLRIICHLFGTEFEIQPSDGDVLFFEDVRERPASIYTMLLQLYLSGKLNHVKAILLGHMNKSGKYLPLLERFLRRLDIPVIYELPLGHESSMIPIRLGDTVSFDSITNTLSFSKF